MRSAMGRNLHVWRIEKMRKQVESETCNSVPHAYGPNEDRLLRVVLLAC